MCFYMAALEKLLLAHITKADPVPRFNWHRWPDWQVSSVDLGSVLESNIFQAFTRAPALTFWWVFLESQNLGTVHVWHSAVIPLLVPSRLAPAPHLPGRSFGRLEFSSWKMLCWGVEEKEFGVYGALKTKCSFSQEDFRIGLGEGSKELVER